MSRVFLSHSSRDSRQAAAVKKWLIEQEPGLVDEIYLDLDWPRALTRARTSASCSASTPFEKPRLEVLELNPLHLPPPRGDVVPVLLIAAQVDEIRPVTASPPPMRRARIRANSSHSRRHQMLRR